jgi:hypothetical protein
MNHKFTKIIVAILVALSWFDCFAQEQTYIGLVVDAENIQPLSYVNIMVVDHIAGTSTNEKGEFRLEVPNVKKSNTVIFSNLGYEDLTITIDGLSKLDTIYLKPQAIALNEVIIGQRKKNKYKTIKLNKINKSRSNLVYSTKAFEEGESLWVPYRASEPTIEAMFFPNNKLENVNEIFLDKIEMYLSSWSQSAIFRIRVYDVSNDNLPNKDLVELPLQTIPKGNHLIEVDLSGYNIEMPQKGLFIGLELIMADSNFSNFENEEGYSTKIQSPFLRYNSQSELYSFYRYSKGKWNSIEQYGPRYSAEMPIRYYKPAINLIVRKLLD